MKRWGGRFLGAGLAVLVLSVAMLLTVEAMGHSRGVRVVPPPVGSLIAARAQGAAYIDAYRLSVSGDELRDLDDVIASAFQKGREVARNESEVVYQDRAPGLVFDVSYQLVPDGERPALTMTTAVRYTSRVGRVYFALIRPIHRSGVPFMLSRMGNWDGRPKAKEPRATGSRGSP